MCGVCASPTPTRTSNLGMMRMNVLFRGTDVTRARPRAAAAVGCPRQPYQPPCGCQGAHLLALCIFPFLSCFRLDYVRDPPCACSTLCMVCQEWGGGLHVLARVCICPPTVFRACALCPHSHTSACAPYAPFPHVCLCALCPHSHPSACVVCAYSLFRVCDLAHGGFSLVCQCLACGAAGAALGPRRPAAEAWPAAQGGVCRTDSGARSGRGEGHRGQGGGCGCQGRQEERQAVKRAAGRHPESSHADVCAPPLSRSRNVLNVSCILASLHLIGIGEDPEQKRVSYETQTPRRVPATGSKHALLSTISYGEYYTRKYFLHFACLHRKHDSGVQFIFYKCAASKLRLWADAYGLRCSSARTQCMYRASTLNTAVRSSWTLK